MLLKGRVKVTGKGFRTKTIQGNTLLTFNQNEICEFQVNGRSFLILPFETAQQAYLCGEKDKYLIISNAVILDDNKKIALITSSPDSVQISIYPATSKLNITSGLIQKKSSPLRSISAWKINIPQIKPNLKLTQTDDRHFVLNAPDIDWSKINDVFITFDYSGDRAICMMNGELQTDDLYTSKPWTIGLKRYADALILHEMYFHFIPMIKDAPYMSYLDKNVIPDFGNKKEFLEIKKTKIEVEYKLGIELN